MTAFVQSAFGQAMPQAEVQPLQTLPPTPPVVISLADTTPGDTLVVFVGIFSSPFGGRRGGISVSRLAGKTRTPPISNSNPSALVQGSDYGYAQIFLASNIQGGPNTITITNSNTSGSGMQAQVNEYAGAWILDKSAGELQNIGTGPFGSGSIIAPTKDNELLVAIVSIADPGNAIATTNSGWTARQAASGGVADSKEDATNPHDDQLPSDLPEIFLPSTTRNSAPARWALISISSSTPRPTLGSISETASTWRSPRSQSIRPSSL